MAAIIRYGMVGGGMKALIGEVHRKALKFDNRVELVAGCFSSHADRNAEVGVEYGLDPARVYANYEEMAKAEAAREDGIDFVSVVTPNNTHYAVCKAFLEAGINVVCEKPLCFTVEQAEELQKLSREKGLLFGVTYTYTGYVMSKVMKEMIAEGKIGKVVSVNAEYAQDWLLGELATGNNTQTNIAVWRTDPAVSGAANCVGDIGTHIENYVHYVTGLKIKRLIATTNKYGKALDLNANIIVEYENGVNGAYWCSQVAAGTTTASRCASTATRARWNGRRKTPSICATRPWTAPRSCSPAAPAASRKRPPRRAACPRDTPRGWSRPLPTSTATMSPPSWPKRTAPTPKCTTIPAWRMA